MHRVMKILVPALAVALVLGLSGTAYAQISCSVASTPVSRATATGHTEPVGDITFICVGGATATTTATVTIDYGATITDNQAYPGGKPIAISSPTSDFAAGAVSISSVSNATGQIVINLPAVAAPAASSTFSVTGVLASLAGTSAASLTANVSVSPGNNYFITAGQNNATVITSVLAGITDPAISNGAGGTASIFTNGAVPDGTLGFRIAENFIDMYRTAAQFNSGGSTQPTQLFATFAGVPTGVSLTGCTATSAPTASASLSASTITSTANTVTVTFNTGLSLTAIDTVTVACTGVTVGSSATLPLTAGNITAQVTLSPTGAALGTNDAVLTGATTGQIPRYADTQLPATPLVVATISPAQTVMLIPYAVSSLGFDTGIALANTTGDPFASGAAVADVNGPVTFTFYPNGGSAFSYTTSATSPGTGLTSGLVDAGSTYVVLLSELLTAAGQTGDFTGYLFAVGDFTNGHGASFITDFSGFTSASPVLTIATPTLAAPRATFESAGQ